MESSNQDVLETYEKECKALWAGLAGNARDVLIQLIKNGPTWDGDLVSKAGRDTLLEKGLAARIIMKGGQQGYQAATNKGLSCYKYSVIYPRKEIVSDLVGHENVSWHKI